MSSNKTKTPSSFAVCHKTHCKQPAYLFWKIQSRVIKLGQQLDRIKRKNKTIN